MATRDETATARTVVLDVPGWQGHLAGQHVDVRLTAPDGYSAQRSYSIASAPAGRRVELTVERLDDGEVSPYLSAVLSVGDLLELRGPVGGWFVWDPVATGPALLVAGGSGLVPLMAMVRTRAAVASGAPFRLVYSVRSPAAVMYRDELLRRAAAHDGLQVRYAYTRAAPAGWTGTVGRVGADVLDAPGWRPDDGTACFVCGPTGFVESVATILTGLGHDPAVVKTERFGATGGGP